MPESGIPLASGMAMQMDLVYRTFAHQDQLYAQGRTTAKPSPETGVLLNGVVAEVRFPCRLRPANAAAAAAITAPVACWPCHGSIRSRRRVPDSAPHAGPMARLLGFAASRV